MKRTGPARARWYRLFRYEWCKYSMIFHHKHKVWFWDALNMFEPRRSTPGAFSKLPRSLQVCTNQSLKNSGFSTKFEDSISMNVGRCRWGQKELKDRKTKVGQHHWIAKAIFRWVDDSLVRPGKVNETVGSTLCVLTFPNTVSSCSHTHAPMIAFNLENWFAHNINCAALARSLRRQRACLQTQPACNCKSQSFSFSQSTMLYRFWHWLPRSFAESECEARNLSRNDVKMDLA